MTVCTFNTRTLASEASIEDLMTQPKKISHRSDREEKTPLNTTSKLEKNCSLEPATVEELVESVSSSTWS
ncbi:hypothetical protein ANCCAN_13528 [Ancylostoma caninum]|uniref:Uncharacterized protein n=1 Tax=Ancylostoma caninum TaxID=29170 RepID=A0A368GA26_ANCCA|nr:hypothetical protein ANCCAN_13528 [Ancylostoma caninum]